MSFEEYADKIKNKSGEGLTEEQQDGVYGLFKQATVGDCNIADPADGGLGSRKFAAWSKHKGKS